MSERQIDERLQELYDKHIPVYSISKLDSINHCLYGAYRSYILHERGIGNVYSSLGGITHDCLEDIMNGLKTEKDLLGAIHGELDNLDVLGIDFPKDRNGGDSIRQGWITDMEHFAKTYKAPKGDFETETFFLYKTDNDKYLQGYIDLTRKNADGSISIYDYKTSSMYSKSDLKEHGRQLILYALGKEQEGYTVKSINWIMLKYVDISFRGKKTARSKNLSDITKTVERKKIGSDMYKYVEQDLYELGIDEIESEIFLNEFKQTNSFDCLPKEIQSKYTVKPCVMSYELNDENRNECKQYIDKTIKMWESLDSSDVTAYHHKDFTRIQNNGKEVQDTFFCVNLCDHYKECVHIHDYFDQMNIEDEDDDIF